MANKILYSAVSTLICCGLIFVYYAIYKKGKKIHFEDLIICLLLVTISSLRYGVGSDYFRYIEASSRWAEMYGSDLRALFSNDAIVQRSTNEFGFVFLSVISYKISQSPYTIFWLLSISIYVPLVFYCRKHTCDSRIAIAVYLLFGYWGISINAIRQSAAMIFILLLEIAIDNKKYLTSILLIICAVSFHLTAIIAVVLIILTKVKPIREFLKPTRRNLVKMIAIGSVFRLCLGIFSRVLAGTTAFSRYSKYLNAEDSDLFSRNFMMIGALIEGILVLLFLYMAIKKIECKVINNQHFSNLVTIIMVGIPFNIVGISRADWLWLSNRFAEYFFVFIVALLPALLSKADDTPTNRGILLVDRQRIPFWFTMIVWHAIFAIVMFNNNRFVIDSYLFK